MKSNIDLYLATFAFLSFANKYSCSHVVIKDETINIKSSTNVLRHKRYALEGKINFSFAISNG